MKLPTKCIVTDPTHSLYGKHIWLVSKVTENVYKYALSRDGKWEGTIDIKRVKLES